MSIFAPEFRLFRATDAISNLSSSRGGSHAEAISSEEKAESRRPLGPSHSNLKTSVRLLPRSPKRMGPQFGRLP